MGGLSLKFKDLDEKVNGKFGDFYPGKFKDFVQASDF